jgi:hypothetical protein
MRKIRNYFIVLASVFAITSACALVGVQDVKADDAAMSDLIKRIEALESKPSGGNVVAPKIRGLKMGFSIRHRFEERSDPNGNNSTDTDFTLQRTRIYLDADVNKNVRGYVKLQDVRTFGEEQNPTGNLARVDMLEGFVELKNLGDFSGLLTNVEARVGRWQQAYGNHRWFGSLNWANQSRSYDGMRVKYDNKKNFWVDGWGYQVNENDTGGVSGSIGNGSGIDGATNGGNGTTLTGKTQDEVFWGLYAHVKATEGIAVEPFFAARNRSRDQNGRENGGTAIAGEDRYHLGARVVGKNIPWLPGVDFTFEQAFQRGTIDAGGATDARFGKLLSPDVGRATSRSTRSIKTHAGAYQVGYTFKNVPWTPRIGYGYVYAKGDNDPNDHDSETFDHLYPTQHATMGYIDFHSWQNIKDHQGHISFKPTKKLLVKVDYHNFSAYTRSDDWYTVGGGKRGVAGTSQSSNYGNEIDLTLKYKLLKNFTVVAGYSKYMVGKFIEDSRAGNSAADPTGPQRLGDGGDTDWFYLMTTMKF